MGANQMMRMGLAAAVCGLAACQPVGQLMEQLEFAGVGSAPGSPLPSTPASGVVSPRSNRYNFSAVRVDFPKLSQRIVPAIKYLNRLSDWLFTMARLANHRAKVPDIPWTPKKS